MKRVCNFNGWVIAERNREKRWVLNNAGNEICLELPGNKLNFYLEIIFCRGQALFSHLLLKREGIIISEKIVRSIMKEENLIVRIIRQKKYSSYLGEISPAVPNEIQRDFHADKPNKKWLTDITEFKIGEGKVYLSPIIDCFDGMPITWTVGTSPNAELVNTMLDNAIVLLKEN